MNTALKTQAEKTAGRRQKARLFLVDDHPVFQEGFAQLLEQQPDFEVCGCAGSCKEALTAVQQLRPDLVILDIGLGGPNGIELLKGLSILNFENRALVLSMYDEDLYAERALRAGAMGYVMKQAPVPEIMNAIRKVLSGERYLSQSMHERVLAGLGKKRPADQGALYEHLSDRELEIFHLIGTGISTREIAEQLHISVKTVETHRAHLKEKLGVTTSLQLFRLAVEWAGNRDNP